MGVRAQVALLVGLLVALATAAASFGAYAASRDEAYATVDEFLTGRGERTALTVEEFGSRFGFPDDFQPPDLDDLPEGVDARGLGRLVEDDAVVSVIPPADAEIPSEFLTDPDVGLPLPTEEGVIVETVEIDGGRYRLRSETLDSGTIVQVARSLEETESTLAAIRTRLWLIGVVVTGLAVAIGWFAARRLARPLEDLSDAAEQIAETGDLDVPLATDAGGEVGQVARSFSGMLDALGDSRRQQQQLVVDAGHELRTPLTTLRTNADLLARGDLSDADTRRALASIKAEVDELAELTAELVELAAEPPADPATEPTDMADIARSAADRAGRRHGRAIVVDSEPAPLIGSPAQLDRAVANLLDNAAKFSPPGSPIEVLVRPDRVEVADRGGGIDAGDLPHVFDRFFRAPAARTLPGSGLGLAIVAKTADAHGGEPFARNEHAGAVVGFTFEPNPGGPAGSDTPIPPPSAHTPPPIRESV